jgi:hypothetical protein
MRRPIRLALAAVAVALAPQMARAEGPPLASVKVYCQPGSLNNCFAFAIQSNDGQITYFIQNLQGSIQAGGPQFAINSIFIQDANVGGANPFQIQFIEADSRGSAGMSIVGTVLRGGNDFFRDSGTDTFGREYAVNLGVGIIGCQNSLIDFGIPEERLSRLGVQTCLPTGLDGFARFDASAFILGFNPDTRRPATLDDFYLRVAGCDVLIGAQSGATPRGVDCSTNIDYASLRAGFTTAPEPSSIALVGSGLLGTGLFGRRRRKV